MGVSGCTKSLALKLFSQLLDHISAKSLLEHLSCPYCCREAGISPLFSGTHCALFGIVELAAALIEMEGCDVNQGDLGGDMPPILAATSEHEGGGGIEAILECQDTIPNKSVQED